MIRTLLYPDRSAQGSAQFTGGSGTRIQWVRFGKGTARKPARQATGVPHKDSDLCKTQILVHAGIVTLFMRVRTMRGAPSSWVGYRLTVALAARSNATATLLVFLRDSSSNAA